jgi:hypothetical protein
MKTGEMKRKMHIDGAAEHRRYRSLKNEQQQDNGVKIKDSSLQDFQVGRDMTGQHLKTRAVRITAQDLKTWTASR